MRHICNGNDLTKIFLKATQRGIEIAAEIDRFGGLRSIPFKDSVCPGETFGGYSYEELLEIAKTHGQMDADELKV